MKRDEWFAALQKLPLVPCGESTGLPRYRAVEAYHCTFCAYTVCARCYNAVPTMLLFPSRDASAAAGRGFLGPRRGDGEVEDTFSTNDGLPRPNTADDVNFSRPRCFLCRKGLLVHENVPVHEWTCEGPRPARRLQRGAGASYDMDVVQRYYTMKEQREKRALSQAPLIAHFHAAEGPPTHVAFSSVVGEEKDDVIGNGPLNRRPFCVEGGSFVFSVQNPRMEVSCVWCGVDRRLSEAHPSFVGDETITPLQKFHCPPSLPGLPPRRFRVRVPYGVYGLHNVHALALYLTNDIFRKATTKLQLTTADTLTVEENEEPPPWRRGQLRTGKVLPRHAVRPLLVVDVLHRIATSDPVWDLLSVEACATYVLNAAVGPLKSQKGCQGVTEEKATVETHAVEETTSNGNNNKNDDKNRGDHDALRKDGDHNDEPRDGSMNEAAILDDRRGIGPPLTWPSGLRCDELLLTLDHLLQGRSVAVYGIASKYFFLQHVSQCAELLHYGVAVADGYRTSAACLITQFREIRKYLRQLQQGSEQAMLRSFVSHDANCESLELEMRSKAPERDHQQVEGQDEEREYYLIDVPTTEESPRSQSYRAPLRSHVGGEGVSQSRQSCRELSEDKNLLHPKERELGETPLVCQGAECVTPYSPAPCAKPRERSILLVRGEEAEDEEAKTPLAAKPSRSYQPQQQLQQEEKERKVRAQPFSQHDTGLDGKASAWSRRHWLREHSDWNYDVPLHVAYGMKRPREDGDKEKVREDEASLVQPIQGRRSRPPRITVSSPEVMGSLRLACRAPLRKCIAWTCLPSITVHRLVSATEPTMTLALKGSAPVGIIILHGVDQLDTPALLELQAIAREHPYRVVLLCSFDDPNWLLSSAAGLLDSFRLNCIHLRSLLLPRVREMLAIKSLSLLTELEAPAAEAGRFSRYANRKGTFSSGVSLPLHDTIRRILFSLPSSFSELLRCMIKRQEASGENVFIPMSLHQENFDECGMMISMARLKAIERELTSNRLAVFNSAENKLMIPQHRKLLKVLEEVLEQRNAVGCASNGAAPVET
ncbi:hypothetical protein ECC02_006660 [Trypanosoma cruzi]|uniref:Uncharacterized protein n=1 Tax=Trypanosoma cruzi TaxID=5693 RepID=A0A7J6Y1S3_TRYCR|nr:hypothetical protein ECC02_006660 [Trypanosoma cruzi]